MTILVLDVENTVHVREDKSVDMSPFPPGNALVSVGWGFVEGNKYVPGDYVFFHHKDMTPDQKASVGENRDRLQAALDDATLLVAHNIKHDLEWLEESGFTYEGALYCTSVGEYLLLRGQKDRSISLKALAEHYDVHRKQADLTEQYLKDGVMFDAIPMEIVEEYGRSDVQSCAEVFIRQRAEYETDRSKGMIPVRDMSMEFLRCLVDMERAGIKIDLKELKKVEADYLAEKATLERRLREIVQEVMGDRPINLSSPEQVSMVVYSRKVVDKDAWIKTFNIGRDHRGKPLRRPGMKLPEFATAVRGNTTPLKKLRAFQCDDCQGAGKVRRITVKGQPYKKETTCKTCAGGGLVYVELSSWAGFRLSPRGVVDVAQGGFVTDKKALERLRYQAEKRENHLAVEFLTASIRLSAIESYLSSFVGGINRAVLADAVLHPHLNQTVTSTARLSSSEPNFQNLPRGATAPVRRVVVSRFPGGEIMEADFSSLEFRVAGELADDPVIFQMVRDGVDAHRKTATIIHRIGYDEVTKEQRQGVKTDSFAPLYGATGADKPDHIRRYYQEFTQVYPGVGRWHKELQDAAIRDKLIVLPSGRQYAFPYARRTGSGGSSGATQIKNYPVQGFATADIVPLSIIRLRRRFRERGLKSVIFLTVHDSIVVDRHPEEPQELLCKLFRDAMCGVREELQARYGYTMRMHLDIEVAAGPNWLDKKEIKTENLSLAA